jgi:hypothetical protein
VISIRLRTYSRNHHEAALRYLNPGIFTIYPCNVNTLNWCIYVRLSDAFERNFQGYPDGFELENPLGAVDSSEKSRICQNSRCDLYIL